MIRIGDRVSFLNEKGFGIVTEIKNKSIAIVETEDGFEVPHPINQLVLVKNSGLKIENNEIVLSYGQKTGKILLIVLPEVEEVSIAESFNFWIVNDTENYFTGVVSRDHKGLRKYLSDFNLGIGEKKKIISVLKKEIKFINFLFMDGILFSKDIFSPKNRIDESISFKRYDYEDISTYETNVLFSKLAKEFLVYDENIASRELYETKQEQSVWSKTNFQNKVVSKASLKNTLEKQEKEFDLHIEELIENHNGMSNVEIMDYQLFIFKKELEKAIDSKFKKIIFIHGIGNGRLKSEILKILKTYKKIEFQDASYQKYGFGATEVLIK
jgi:hypothetical protein